MSLPRTSSGRVRRRERIVSEERPHRHATRSTSVPSPGVNSGCIDLTNDDSVHEPATVIDLTSVNDSPIVLLSPVEETSQRRRSRRTRSNYSSEDVGPTSSHMRMQRMLILETDNKDSIPMFNLPGTPHSHEGEALNTLTGASPAEKRIYCPICLDDSKQIKRSGRQVYSTVCGHIFCNNCISQAIVKQGCCPICRKKLTLKKVHVLYL